MKLLWWLLEGGFPRLYWSSDISNTSFWIGFSSLDNGCLLFPSAVRLWLPTSSITFGSNPSWSVWASITRHNFYWFLGRASSLIITTSLTCRFLLGRVHFCLVCNAKKKYFFPLDQYSFVKCWTCRHNFLEYRSAEVHFPGGGKTTFVFKVRKWFGVSGSAVSDGVIPSDVRGRLLTTASAYHMKVRRASSFIWWPFSSRRAQSPLLTVLIWRSQTPPMWLAVRTLSLSSNQSQFSFSISCFNWLWSISANASLSSLRAPITFEPLSMRIWRTGPRLHMKRRRALM